MVGIIANPASGKDIRRLVSHATVVNNHEKVSIVRRLLLALYASGVSRVQIMPDPFGIGGRALDGLRDRPDILAATALLDMLLEGSAEDSQRAAHHLREAGAGCIVILGGDGTCRVVSKTCGAVPLLPISTGTNNVVPTFIEGTVAGLAAAYVACHPHVAPEQLCTRHKRLIVHVDGEEVDQALVEVAVISARFTGARAIWQAEALRQIFVTRAQPVNIGLSSVIGMVRPVGPTDPGGASALVGSEGRRVMAPLAPGVVVPVTLGTITDLKPGVRYPVVDERPAVLALDGEREIVLHEGQRAEVRLERDGPWIVDVERTLRHAVAEGAFAA
ncbi:MAG: NAD(+)/NADH kinase [Chloroflexi bacterium]|nr:NAD(+)/NADH kinase [Chloroflexota bacterium]